MTILRERYRLLELPGEGGMGAVYRAEQLALERSVAIKFLKAEHPDEKFATRFAREAKAVAQLNHPNIMQVYDFDRAEDGRYFMVLELLHGQDLGQVLATQTLSPERVLAIVRTVADALRYAHAHHTIHRDIKPQNVFITDEGTIKVMDFGIARILGSDTEEGRATLTETGAFIGTPAYISPEQAQGERNLDQRSDIYSLGVMLFYMLTGELPFSNESPVKTILAHINQAPPLPSSINPSLSPALDALVQKMLAKKPQDRFPDMGAVINALDGLATTVSATNISRHFDPEQPTTQGTLGGLLPAAPRRWVGGAGLLVLLGLLALGALFFLRQEREEPAAAVADFAPASAGELLIVVADFDGDEVDVARRATDVLRDSQVAADAGAQLRVELASQTVANETEAAALAEHYGALLVVWGVQDATGLTVTLQAPRYPANTLTRLSFIVPNNAAFGEILADELPFILDVYTRALLMQDVIRRADYLPLFRLGTSILYVQPANLRTLPKTTLDAQVVTIFTGMAENTPEKLEAADEAATAILSLKPDDPAFYFIRWNINAMFLHRPERASIDLANMERLMPESSLGVYAASLNSFMTEDYAAVIALSANLPPTIDESGLAVANFYRVLALVAVGEFPTAQQEAQPSDATRYLDDLMAVTPVVRALLDDLRGVDNNTDKQQARTDRILERSASVFTGDVSSAPPILLVFGGYIYEINNNPTVARLAYQFGLSSDPQNYLLNWRAGVLAEQADDPATAYTHYQTAHDNAPVPFPIALVSMARVMPAEACTLLETAAAEAATDPAFYAPLLEQIAAARANCAE